MLKALEEKDALICQKFAEGELYRSAKTMQIVDLIAAKIRSRKRSGIMPGELVGEVYDFDDDNVNKARNILSEYMINGDYEHFAFDMLAKMQFFDFDSQPSVNFFKDGSEDSITLPSKKRVLYEEFKKVSLLAHTCNVMIEFKRFMDNRDFTLSREDECLLALACLLHDFGKSISLATHYGFYEEGMKKGKYTHALISEKLIKVFAMEFSKGYLLRDVVQKKLIERLQNIVATHHAKDYVVVDRLVKYVVLIDANARTIEYERLMKIKDVKESHYDEARA